MKRIAQRGYGFVVAGATTGEGRTVMVASQCVRDIEVHHDQNDIHKWGDMSARHIADTKLIASLASHDQQMVQVLVEPGHGGYAEGWRRLLDLWVPPQFTDETRAQILTHYTFNAPDEPPPPMEPPWMRAMGSNGLF